METWMPSEVLIVCVELLPDVVTVLVMVFADGVVSFKVTVPSDAVAMVTIVTPTDVLKVQVELLPGWGMGRLMVPDAVVTLTDAPDDANVVVELIVEVPDDVPPVVLDEV